MRNENHCDNLCRLDIPGYVYMREEGTCQHLWLQREEAVPPFVLEEKERKKAAIKYLDEGLKVR
jgi:hypothetical protein